MRLTKAFDHASDRHRLRPRVARFLQIEIVDDLPDLHDRRVRQREAPREDFERAQPALMAERPAIHVERHI